ncbi:MAG: hypothetical protein IID39_05130 [Planctomycetes bacterium]|nr:hypothetical protein [Planctomycetota bacterium]
MATTIAKMAVILSANTAQFEKGMKKAGTRARKFGASVKKVAKRAAIAFAAIAVAATAMAVVAGRAFFRMVRSSFGVLDVLGKMSSRIGVAVADIQLLNLAMKKAGGTAEGLEKGLRQLARTESQALQGLSTAVRAFKQLGLDPKVLIKKSVADQLGLIAEAMANVANQNVRMQISMDLFGRAGKDFLNLLQNFNEEMERNRKILEGGDFLFTDKEVKGVEKANDAITDLKTAIEGLAQRVAISFAPTIRNMAEDILKFTQKIGKAFSDLQFFIEVIASKLGRISPEEVMKNLARRVGEKGVFGDASTGLEDTTNPALSLLRQILDKESKLLDAVTLQAATLNTLVRDANVVAWHGGLGSRGPLPIRSLLGGP